MKTYIHLLNRLSKPLMITPSYHQIIMSVIDKHMDDSPMEMPEDEMMDTEPYDLSPGVRVIPICGPIAYKVSEIEKICGICDLKDVRESIIEAANDESVKTIVLDINSCGGEVTSLFETCNLIQEVGKKKNCVAYCDTVACSAAYALYLACNERYATPSADLASVGVYCSAIDSSKYYEMQGLTVNQFASGKYKGMGAEGVSLTDVQKAFLQDSVNKLATQFKAYVKDCMPDMPDDLMEGQSVPASELEQYGITLVSCPEEIFQ